LWRGECCHVRLVGDWKRKKRVIIDKGERGRDSFRRREKRVASLPRTPHQSARGGEMKLPQPARRGGRGISLSSFGKNESWSPFEERGGRRRRTVEGGGGVSPAFSRAKALLLSLQQGHLPERGGGGKKRGGLYRRNGKVFIWVVRRKKRTRIIS